MRKVGSYKSDELSSEEYFVLLDFIASVKNLQEVEVLIKILLTESELAAVSQRLAILRMIAKNFTYNEIEEKLKVATNTIAKTVNSKSRDKSQEKMLDDMLRRYRYNPAKNHQQTSAIIQITSDIRNRNPLIPSRRRKTPQKTPNQTTRLIP